MIKSNVPISASGIYNTEVLGSVWKYIVQCWGAVMWALNGMIEVFWV